MSSSRIGSGRQHQLRRRLAGLPPKTQDVVPTPAKRATIPNWELRTVPVNGRKSVSPPGMATVDRRPQHTTGTSQAPEKLASGRVPLGTAPIPPEVQRERVPLGTGSVSPWNTGGPSGVQLGTVPISTREKSLVKAASPKEVVGNEGGVLVSQLPGPAPSVTYPNTRKLVEAIKRADPGAWEAGAGIVLLSNWTDHGHNKEAMRAALRKLPDGTWLNSRPEFPLSDGRSLTVAVYKVNSNTIAISSGGVTMQYGLLPNGALDTRETVAILTPVLNDPNVRVRVGVAGPQAQTPQTPLQARIVATPPLVQAPLVVPPASYDSTKHFLDAIRRSEPGSHELGSAVSNLYAWAERGQGRANIRADMLGLGVGEGIVRSVSDGRSTMYFSIHKVKPGFVAITSNGYPNKTLIARLKNDGTLDLKETVTSVNREMSKAKPTEPVPERRSIPNPPPTGPVESEHRRGVLGVADYARQNALNAAILEASREMRSERGPLDGTFERVNAIKVPTYKLRGYPNTFISIVDRGHEVGILSQRNATTTAQRPNPSFNSAPIYEQLARWDRPANIDMAFNASFFTRYGSPTGLSFPLVVNGEVLAAGQIEDRRKKILYSAGAGMQIADWKLNTGTATKPPTSESLIAVQNATRGMKIGVVGFDPYDPAFVNKKENGITMVAVNSAGEMAVLISKDQTTPGEMARVLRKAGFGNAILLDSGNSTQAVYTQTSNIDGHFAWLSATNRRIPITIYVGER